MAGKTFQFKLITPAGKLLDAAAVSVNLPAHDGQLGVLPDRAAMVTKLGKGTLTVRTAEGGAGRNFSLDGGFAQMVSNKLTVLSTRATEKAN